MGLLQQSMPAPQGAPMPVEQPVEQPVEGGEEQPNVTPDEQAQYDEFMDNAYKLIYSDNTMPKVLERIKASPDPKEAVANIAASTVDRLKDSAEKAGKAISDDVLFQGGKEVVEDLADMTAEAGIHDFTEQEMEAVWYMALDLFQQMQGEQSPEHQAAAMQDVEMLKGAQDAGGLDQVLPGITDRQGVE